jgi:hypothetical protein
MLVWMREFGAFKGVRGAGRCLECKRGGLTLTLRTPFQKLPEPLRMNHRLAVLAQRYNFKIPVTLPYGLDIWESNRKVLNLQ